jgi:uncharacterized membrane protein YfcA
MAWLLVVIVGLVAGTIGGLIGFGSSIMLMPALVFTVGAKAAVPIMAIAGLMANISRVVLWWREVDWKAAGVFSATAIPAAALGARTLVSLDARKVEMALGVFFLVMIPVRRWLLSHGFKLKLWQFLPVGAAIGFLSGLVATVGPINTPFFLAYGLVKGPYVSTEALGSAMMGISKATVFRTFGALPWDLILSGLLVGGAVTVGSWFSKQLMHRISTAKFNGMMDALLGVAGLLMLWGAFWPGAVPG